MSEKDKDVLEEKVFNIPLTSAWRTPIKNRTPKAIRDLRACVMKHMKTDRIAISSEVNELFWQRGIEGTPGHIRIRAEKDKDNKVTVYLVKEE
jgi:large subunit ribosomal protein L31e